MGWIIMVGTPIGIGLLPDYTVGKMLPGGKS